MSPLVNAPVYTFIGCTVCQRDFPPTSMHGGVCARCWAARYSALAQVLTEVRAEVQRIAEMASTLDEQALAQMQEPAP